MQRTLSQKPEAVLQQLTLAFSGVPGVTLTSPVPNSLVATRRFIPGGAIVLAVLLFPIGLLFLLMKTTYTVTMLVTDREAGSTLEIKGDWDERIMRVVDEVLSAAGHPLLQRHGRQARRLGDPGGAQRPIGSIAGNARQVRKSDLAIGAGVIAVVLGLALVFGT
jgi:hypothetical protein